MDAHKWSDITQDIVKSGVVTTTFVQKLEKKLADKGIAHPHLTAAISKLYDLGTSAVVGQTCTTCQKCIKKCEKSDDECLHECDCSGENDRVS